MIAILQVEVPDESAIAIDDLILVRVIDIEDGICIAEFVPPSPPDLGISVADGVGVDERLS